MRVRSRIGVLACHQLKGIHALRSEQVPGGQNVPVADHLLATAASSVRVDMLRSIRVQSTRVNVRPIGKLCGVRSEKALNNRAKAGIGGERSSLVGRGNQHIPVYDSSDFL